MGTNLSKNGQIGINLFLGCALALATLTGCGAAPDAHDPQAQSAEPPMSASEPARGTAVSEPVELATGALEAAVPADVPSAGSSHDGPSGQVKKHDFE